MATLGFGSTMVEFSDLLKDFVVLKSTMKHFTNNRPDYNWMSSFLEWHKLSFKES